VSTGGEKKREERKRGFPSRPGRGLPILACSPASEPSNSKTLGGKRGEEKKRAGKNKETTEASTLATFRSTRGMKRVEPMTGGRGKEKGKGGKRKVTHQFVNVLDFLFCWRELLIAGWKAGGKGGEGRGGGFAFDLRS